MMQLEQWISALRRSVKTILVLDVVESVRLAELDELAFVAKWMQLSTFIRDQLVPQFSGRTIKSLGDGLMAEFSRQIDAVNCGFAILDAIAPSTHQVATIHSNYDLTLRIGLHCGEVFSDQHDIYGRSVNLAARLSTLAGPNQMVVSSGIRDSVCDHLDASIEDMGDCFVKHVAEPVHAFRLRSPSNSAVPMALPNETVGLQPAIAVVPFLPREGQSSDPWIGEVLADEVIAAISRSPDLTVISRLSTSPLKNLTIRSSADVSDLLTAARERLHVQYVLTGQFRQLSDRLELHVELVDTRRFNVLWADRLQCSVSSLLASDSEPVLTMVNAISVAIVKNEMSWVRARALPTVESYGLLIAAIGYMHRASTSDFMRVAEILRVLIDRHPRQPLPRAWLAKWHALCVTRGLSEATPRSVQEALSETGRALDIDPECSLALAIEGMVYCQMRKDLVTATDRYSRALRANPNDSQAWLYSGVLHSFKNEVEEAAFAGEKALALSPLDPMLYFYQSLAASAILPSKNYPRVIGLAKESIRANRSHSSTYRVLAIAQALSGDVAAARTTLQGLLSLEPNFTVSDFLRRSPSADLEMGKRSAQALRVAGLPE